MKTIKVLSTAVLSLIWIGFVSCGNDDPKAPNPDVSSESVEDAIIGKWLLASSDATEWITYNFEKSGQISAEWLSNGNLQSGIGVYFTNNDKLSLSGSIDKGNGKFFYIDWIFKAIQLNQIDIDIYGDNGNKLIQSTSLYRILTSLEVGKGESLKPDYRGFAGSVNNSEYKSLNPDIVSVDAVSGEICGVREGVTFVVFKTQGGFAAMEVNVREKVPSLKDNILGIWVTDNKGSVFTWERDVFGPDNYFYSNWCRDFVYPTDNESAQGTYSVDEEKMIVFVSAKTPYGQRLNCEYRIQEMDRFSFYTHVYSGGDKTGEFYYQRVLESVSLEVGGEMQPEYISLTDGRAITGYKSHDDGIATVDSSDGRIRGVSNGMTYIDVVMNQGTAVVEVTVGSSAKLTRHRFFKGIYQE